MTDTERGAVDPNAQQMQPHTQTAISPILVKNYQVVMNQPASRGTS